MRTKTKPIVASRSLSAGFTPSESAFLASAVEDGVRIQPRFRPAPLLARTGRGFMACAGVGEIARAKRISGRRK